MTRRSDIRVRPEIEFLPTSIPMQPDFRELITELPVGVYRALPTGERKLMLVPVKELFVLTGYIRGGVTAFAGKRDYPVYVDETIELFDVVSVSAGARGLQILLTPEDYLKVTKGKIAAIAEDKEEEK